MFKSTQLQLWSDTNLEILSNDTLSSHSCHQPAQFTDSYAAECTGLKHLVAYPVSISLFFPASAALSCLTKAPGLNLESSTVSHWHKNHWSHNRQPHFCWSAQPILRWVAIGFVPLSSLLLHWFCILQWNSSLLNTANHSGWELYQFNKFLIKSTSQWIVHEVKSL